MLQTNLLNKLRNIVGVAKADIKNISLSPYILEELLDSYEQLTDMLTKEKKTQAT